MGDLAAQLDTSDRHRGPTAPGEPAHAVGNSATAGKVNSRPIIMLIVSGIALIAAIVIGTAITIVNLRDSALANSERELGNTALLIAKYADQEIGELELVQSSLIEKIQALGNVSHEDFERKMSGVDVHTMLKNKIAGLSQVSSVALINSDGRLINDSLEWPVPAIDATDRSYFEALKSNARLTSFVSEPIRDRRTGNWTVVLARKITALNGEFLGAVLGTIELQFFENFFESVILGEGSSTALYRNDGTLLVRYPRIEPVIGHVFRGAIDALGKRQHATARLVGKMDGKDRLLTAQRLKHFPLFISVGVDVATALSNWYKEVIVLIVLGGFAALTTAVMVFIIARQLLQGKKQFQLKFDEQKLQLNTAFSNMSQGLVMFDAAARLVVSNDRYRQIYNLPPDLTKPGCAVVDLLKHRAAHGTFSGNPEEYVSDLLATIAQGKISKQEVETGDGRIISMVNQPMAGGGWVATHEDITEQRKIVQERDRDREFLNEIVNNVPATIIVKNASNLRYVLVNQAGEEYLGISRDRIIGKTAQEVWPKETADVIAGHDEQLLQSDGYLFFDEHPVDTPGKGSRFVTSKRLIIRDSKKKPQYLLGVIEDVTERKRAKDELRSTQHFLNTIVENAPLPIVVKSVPDMIEETSEYRFTLINRAAEELFGISRDQMIGKNSYDIYSKDHADFVVSRDIEAARADHPIQVSKHIVEKPNRDIRTITSRKVAIRDDNGKPEYLLSLLEDVTEKKRAEDELRRTQAFLDMIVENMPTPIIVKDVHEHRYTLVNRTTEECFGISRDKMIGKKVHELFRKEEADAVVMHDNEALQSDRPLITDTYPLHTSHNGTRLLTAKRLAIRDNGGNPQHILTVLEDVTERSRSEQRIAHMAHHDTLTDLPNRAAFNERLASTLDKAAMAHEQFAIMSIDFDRFKEINDLFGHAAGDALLLEVARRLQVTAGEAFLARLGGDEFSLIVVDGPQPATASALAGRLLAAVADEFEIEGLRLRMGLSIGGAVYPTDGADAKTLMSNADAALYRAKAETRGSVRFFEAEMDTRQRERLALQNDLRLAIDRGELTLHYQPQVRMTGEPVGFEALVRWQCPKRGLVAPSTFIPIAEESSLIVSLGEWVLREACREAASWPRPLSIAVNVSPIQFHHGDLPSLVHSILLETGLAPARLELEITEGVLINDFSRAVSILRRLKSLGVQIALDDFGTGYSSLSYLHSFAFDRIKIDRAFIGDLDRNRHSMAIVRAVISLGQSLELPVLAEGVETEIQLAFLLQEGCDEVQGYLTGRPLPIANYAELVGRQAIARQKLHPIVAA